MFKLRLCAESLTLISLALSVLTLSALLPCVSVQAKDAAARQVTTENKADDLVGDWVSEWGPVNFKRENNLYSGSWQEGKGKIGKISSGKYDAKTGEVDFDFEETWTHLKGKAKLKLSSDKGTLSGNWVRGKDKGTWSMHRPKNEFRPR